MIYLISASYANEYELQNYIPLLESHEIKVITSHHPLTHTTMSTVPLWSLTDLPMFPFRRQILNRLIGGEQWLFGLEKIVHKVDILHTAETYTPYTHQAVKLRKAGMIKKLICTCWETIPHNNESLTWLKKWKNEAYQYVDIFHVPTQCARKALINEGVEPSKIIVIPYGVSRERFQKVTTKIVNKKPIVLTVARSVSDKGYDHYHTIINPIRSLADFRWVSNLSYDDVPTAFTEADIFFLPSQVSSTWEEQYGMVLIEAMMAGLPIVSTTSGAIPEVVGEAGLLSVPSDYEDMTNKLYSLISDPLRRAIYSQRSLKRSKRYEVNRIAKKLVKLYT